MSLSRIVGVVAVVLALTHGVVIATLGTSPTGSLLSNLSQFGASSLPRRRVFLTAFRAQGYTSGAMAQHGFLQQEAALLQKPLRMADLAQKVREILDAPAASS